MVMQQKKWLIFGLILLGLFCLIKWDYVYGNIYMPSDKVNVAVSPEPTIQLVDCDYILENGLIVNGTGSPAFKGSVGIKGDIIVAVGEFNACTTAKRINASGLVISPGFIDIHTHTEDYWSTGGSGEMALEQGVTTHIVGNCGTAPAQIGEYLNSLKEIPVNVGALIGYKSLRRAVIDKEPGKVGSQELKRMKEFAALGMKEGAFGLSVGLGYYPQSLATGSELVELCKTIKEYHGFYATHIRNEEKNVITAVKEAISIGIKAGVPVEYSHVKTAGPSWGEMSCVLDLIDQARNQGLDITGDVYAYTYSSLDAAADGLKQSMKEEDMILALKHPLILIGSDSGISTKGIAGHPRAFANYSRILSRYVRDKQVLSLEAAVHKMTQMPAHRLQLEDRGVIAAGKKADIAVFNLAGVTENATRSKPSLCSTGMKYVFVNGGLALAAGEVTGLKAGSALKHGYNK